MPNALVFCLSILPRPLLDGFKHFCAPFDGGACTDGQTGAHMCDGAVAADLCTGTDHNVLSQDAALDHGTCL